MVKLPRTREVGDPFSVEGTDWLTCTPQPQHSVELYTCQSSTGKEEREGSEVDGSQNKNQKVQINNDDNKNT